VRPDHINFVYVVGPIPPLTRNCEREDFIVYGHCLVAFTGQPNGKTDGKIALKPGDFGMRASVRGVSPVWG